jgi:hypothetical protein
VPVRSWDRYGRAMRERDPHLSWACGREYIRQGTVDSSSTSHPTLNGLISPSLRTSRHGPIRFRYVFLVFFLYLGFLVSLSLVVVQSTSSLFSQTYSYTYPSASSFPALHCNIRTSNTHTLCLAPLLVLYFIGVYRIC